jgi:hypothetical protein
MDRSISSILRRSVRSRRSVSTRTSCCAIVLAPSRRREVMARHSALAIATTSNPEWVPSRRSSANARNATRTGEMRKPSETARTVAVSCWSTRSHLRLTRARAPRARKGIRLGNRARDLRSSNVIRKSQSAGVSRCSDSPVGIVSSPGTWQQYRGRRPEGRLTAESRVATPASSER